jgi:hypothetical protein
MRPRCGGDVVAWERRWKALYAVQRADDQLPGTPRDTPAVPDDTLDRSKPGRRRALPPEPVPGPGAIDSRPGGATDPRAERDVAPLIRPPALAAVQGGMGRQLRSGDGSPVRLQCRAQSRGGSPDISHMQCAVHRDQQLTITACWMKNPHSPRFREGGCRGPASSGRSSATPRLSRSHVLVIHEIELALHLL